MENKNKAKMAFTLGVTGVLAGVGLLITEKTIIGLSTIVAGTGLAIMGFKTINDKKT